MRKSSFTKNFAIPREEDLPHSRILHQSTAHRSSHVSRNVNARQMVFSRFVGTSLHIIAVAWKEKVRLLRTVASHLPVAKAEIQKTAILKRYYWKIHSFLTLWRIWTRSNRSSDLPVESEEIRRDEWHEWSRLRCHLLNKYSLFLIISNKINHYPTPS